MNISQLRKRILLLKRHADVMPPLSNAEMAALGEAFLKLLNQNKALEEAIKKGMLQGEPGKPGRDGYNPVPDKDYLSRRETERIIHSLFEQAAKNIKNGEDGKDAEITEEHIAEAARRAYQMIELPDFEELFTKEPEAIRNALELLSGDERLDKSAIKGLEELERGIDERFSKLPAGGISPNAVQAKIDRRIIASVTAPLNPEVNQLWVDIS